jgi:hypothetical protein
VRSCALAASAAGLSAKVASSAFGVVASGVRLAVKNGAGVVTLVKFPESEVAPTITSLKVWVAAKAPRLPCSTTCSAPASFTAPALKVG